MSDEKVRILTMLSEHKITAAEAERLLDALESRPEQPPRAPFRMPPMPPVPDLGFLDGMLKNIGFNFCMHAGGEPLDKEFELPDGACVQISHHGGDLKVIHVAEVRKGCARSDGPASVSMTDRGCDISSAGGDLDVALPTVARITVKAAGGDVHIEAGGAAVDADCMGGDLTVENAGGIQAKMTGGDANIAGLRLTDGSHSVQHTGGDVRVSLTADSSVAVTVNSVGGDVRSNLPGTSKGGFISRSTQYRLGDGKATLTVNSTGGDVEINAE